MYTEKLTEFLRTVRPEVTGCPEEVQLHAVREALRIFCTRTQLWRQALDPIDLLAGIGDYDLDPPYGTEVAMVLRAQHKETALQPVHVEDLDWYRPSWRDEESEQITEYCLIRPTLIRFIPKPEAAETAGVSLIAALSPSREATECEEFLVQQWESVIASGALMRLLIMNGKPWANPNLAAVHRDEFYRGVKAGQVQAARGSANTDRQMRLPRFGGSRNTGGWL